MSLYRAIYEREGKIRGMTFWAENEALAALYAYTVLQRLISALEARAWIYSVVKHER